MPALLLDVAVRAVLIAAGTAFILRALRIRPAASRHAAWTMVLVAMLLLPLWSVAGPRITLPVLPSRLMASPSQSASNGDLVVSATGATLPIQGDIVAAATEGAPLRMVWLLGVVYLLGVLAFLGRLAIGTVHARRLCRAAVMRNGRATSA